MNFGKRKTLRDFVVQPLSHVWLFAISWTVACQTMATHSSTLAWKIPCWRNLVGAVHEVTKSRTWLSNFTFTFHFHALEKEMTTHSSVLAWRIPGTGESGGLPSMGSHRVRHDWNDLAAVAAADTSVPHCLLKIVQIHVHWLGDGI